jgi:hypothetical protein
MRRLLGEFIPAKNERSHPKLSSDVTVVREQHYGLIPAGGGAGVRDCSLVGRSLGVVVAEDDLGMLDVACLV